MSSNDKDYKETLFLPNTDFPMRANLPEREKEWLDRWEKLNIFLGDFVFRKWNSFVN